MFDSILPAPGGANYLSPSLSSSFDRIIRKAYAAAGITPPEQPHRLADTRAHLDELAEGLKQGPPADLDEFRQHALDTLLVLNRDRIEAHARIVDEDVDAGVERVEKAWTDIRPKLAKTLQEAQKAAQAATSTGKATATDLLAQADLMLRVLPGLTTQNTHAAFLTTTVHEGEKWNNMADPAPLNPSEERDQLKAFLDVWNGRSSASGDLRDRVEADRAGALLKLMSGTWPDLKLDLARDGADVADREAKISEATQSWLMPTAHQQNIVTRAAAKVA